MKNGAYATSSKQAFSAGIRRGGRGRKMPVRACTDAGWRGVQGCREIDPFSAQAGRGDDRAAQGVAGSRSWPGRQA